MSNEQALEKYQKELEALATKYNKTVDELFNYAENYPRVDYDMDRVLELAAVIEALEYRSEV